MKHKIKPVKPHQSKMLPKEKRNITNTIVKVMLRFFYVIFMITMPTLHSIKKLQKWKKILFVSYMIFYYIGIITVTAVVWIQVIIETSNGIALIVNIVEGTSSLTIIITCYSTILFKDKLIRSLESDIEEITHSIKDPDGTYTEFQSLLVFIIPTFYVMEKHLHAYFDDGFYVFVALLARSYVHITLFNCLVRITIILLNVSKQFTSINYLFENLQYQYSLYSEFKQVTRKRRSDYRLEMFNRLANYFIKLCDVVQIINNIFSFILFLDLAITVFHIFIQIMKMFKVYSVTGVDRLFIEIWCYILLQTMKYVAMIIGCKEVEKQIRQRGNIEMLDECKTKEFEQAVKLFAAELERRTVRVSAWGHFYYDYSLLVGIFTGLVTNMTLIMQLPFPTELN